MKVVAIIGGLAFMPIVTLYIFLVLGFPYGEFAMGGKYKVVPREKRIIFVVSLVIQLAAIVIILQMVGILPLIFSFPATQRVCYLFAGYFTLNILANVLSKSKKERIVMTPLSLVIAVCFWLIAIGN
ncbi:hypothetical protein SANA_14510 [Gottschalkiaceae bacterium SANA]|nr:hypothetical protein SANA_14510 [Gottschalkiaceae bacterium SANA]